MQRRIIQLNCTVLSNDLMIVKGPAAGRAGDE